MFKVAGKFEFWIIMRFPLHSNGDMNEQFLTIVGNFLWRGFLKLIRNEIVAIFLIQKKFFSKFCWRKNLIYQKQKIFTQFSRFFLFKKKFSMIFLKFPWRKNFICPRLNILFNLKRVRFPLKIPYGPCLSPQS